jgi:hypothetical protein
VAQEQARGHVTKQHVVSQVVLGQFADEDYELEVEDVRRPGRWRRKAPAAVGYVNDFVRHDSAGAEALWQTVETRLRVALDELNAGGVPAKGSATEEAVRDCLALHWARGSAVKEVSERAYRRVRQRSMGDLAAHPDVLAALHERATGLEAGPEDLRAVNERLHSGPTEILSGEHFSERVQHFFEKARRYFAGRSLQVGVCADDAEDLLLSDCPVLTPSRSRPGLNPEQGVRLDQAHAALMPVGPRVLVSLHSEPERAVVAASDAARMNDWQRSVRKRQMYRRPVPGG